MAVTSLVGADLTRVYTAADFAVGTVAHDATAGKEYVFCSLAAVTVADDLVTIDKAFAAAAATATTVAASLEGAPVGISPVVATAASWQFVQIKGPSTVNAISGGGAAAHVVIFTTATTGEVDDVDTSMYALLGMTLTEAEGATTAGKAACLLNYPRTNTATGTTIVS